MDKWYEILSKFILDLAKIVFTAIILGKFISPENIGWYAFLGGIIVLLFLVVASKRVYEEKGSN